MQQVEYSVFPSVRDDALIPTVNKVLGHVRRSQLSPREFREWLKDETLWDKEGAAATMRFLDVQQEGQVRLGPWAEQFFAANTDDQVKDLLFKRLLDENTLLVKYTMEALDIEGGGRLHSTHELHRMLTSYVYPGKPIGLVPFQNWIKWMVASGRVKLVGIRWGLTDLGKQVVPRMRTIDADEFLEDEKAEQAAPAKTATAPAPAAAPTPAPAPTKPALPARMPKVEAKPAAAESDEDGLDLPPEPEPVDESVAAKYEAQYEQAPPVEAAPAPAPMQRARTAPAPAAVAAAPLSAADLAAIPMAQPRTTTPPQTLVREAALEVACTHAPLDAAEVIATLRAHGRARGLGGGSLLQAHGLESRMAQNEAARHLFLAALLARLYGLQPDGSLATLLVDKVGALQPAAILLDRPEALAEVVVRWGLGGGDPGSQGLRAALLDATIGGRALKAQADLPTMLAEAPSPEVLVGQLGQGLLRAAPVTTQLWLVREMVRVGLWTRPSATEIAFVPTRAVRLMAYRLRLIDTHFAQGAALLLQVARRLAALLPAGSVEAAAFEDLAQHDHLRFDCCKVPICQQPCAWAPVHGEVA
jgi:hypothetical protein